MGKCRNTSLIINSKYMTMLKYFLCLIMMLATLEIVKSQEPDLSKIASQAAKSSKHSVTIATFKSTHLINFQTLEVCGKRTLDFRISHRFGDLSSGAYNFWGIDGPASIRLGLDYSYDGRL